MIVMEIMVPVSDNTGHNFTHAHHTAFQARAITLFGGFSRQPLVNHGGWAGDDGVVYTDDTYTYTIAVPNLLQDSGKVHELVAFAKRHYAQHAIYVSYLGQAEIL